MNTMNKILPKQTGWARVMSMFIVMSILPGVLHAQNFNWFALMFTSLKAVLRIVVPVLVLLALVVFLWGVVVFIFNADDESARADGKKRIMWGIVGLFVIVSVWGLVYLLSTITNIFGAVGINAPQALFN
jgi:hypothetical protein